MAEMPELRLYEPRLKANRLVPASKEGRPPKAGVQVADVQVADLPNREAVFSTSGEHQTIFCSPGAEALAAQARRITSGARQLLQTLPAVLETLEAPEAAHHAAVLLRSILTALPDELSNGLSATIAQIDWAFSRLLNQPGQPGLIEQIVFALGAPSEGEAAPADATAHDAEIEALRQLHRDLVALQQGWDALVEEYLPSPPAPPARASAAHPAREHALPAPRQGIVLKKRPAVASRTSASGLRTSQQEGTRRPSSHWLHRTRGMRVRVALASVLLLLLVASGLGVLMLKDTLAPASGPQTVASLVHQPGPPGVTATPSPAPTATQQPPTATPTPLPTLPPKPTLTPQPSATPISSANFWCPSAMSLCISSPLLAVPCAGQGTATLQLKNNTGQPQSWQATASKTRGSPLVTLSASRGVLQPGQVVTLTVAAANAHTHSGGMLTITTAKSKGQTLVLLLVCE